MKPIADANPRAAPRHRVARQRHCARQGLQRRQLPGSDAGRRYRPVAERPRLAPGDLSQGQRVCRRALCRQAVEGSRRPPRSRARRASSSSSSCATSAPTTCAKGGARASKRIRAPASRAQGAYRHAQRLDGRREDRPAARLHPQAGGRSPGRCERHRRKARSRATISRRRSCRSGSVPIRRIRKSSPGSSAGPAASRASDAATHHICAAGSGRWRCAGRAA